jgi:sulfur relay (sulfurtransferase) DsrF/TusC family protein
LSAELNADSGSPSSTSGASAATSGRKEIKATLDLLWGGSSAVEKRMRLLVSDGIFAIKSRESVAELSLDKLERGLKILQAFEKRVRAEEAMLDKGELELLSQLDTEVREYDEGKAEEAEQPF